MQRAQRASLPHVLRGTGPGLVLVHGGGATAQSTYGGLLGPLSQHFTLVAPDYSEALAGTATSLDVLADRHVDTAVRAGLERFAMVGHSLGTMIAVKAAVRHPDRVTGLVLTAGFARAGMSTRLKVQLWRAMLTGDRELLSRYLMTLMLSDRYLGAMTQEQVDGFAELVGLTLRAGTTEQIDLVLSLDERSDLPLVAAPTLVVATSADHLVPPRMSVELAAAIPGATLVELDCGHQPGLECAPEWLQVIKDFLSVRQMNGQVTQ